MSKLQDIPVKPGVQVHVNSLTPSWQVPLFEQGFERQLSMLFSQWRPSNPSLQSHWNALIPSMHVKKKEQKLRNASDALRRALAVYCTLLLYYQRHHNYTLIRCNFRYKGRIRQPGSVQAGIWVTFINVVLALFSNKTFLANAVKLVVFINAGCVVLTFYISTFLHSSMSSSQFLP